jgi:hypothetical protein
MMTSTPMTARQAATARTTARSRRPTNRLGRNGRRAVVTAHVLAACGWFGMAVLVALAPIAAAQTADTALASALHRLVGTAVWVTAPTGLVALATGIVLGVGTTWGVVRHWWVMAKLVIDVAIVVTDVALVRVVAHTAFRTGSAPVPLYGSTIAHVVLLATATVLSVYKPGGRTPWAR